MDQYKHNPDVIVKDYLAANTRVNEQLTDGSALIKLQELNATVERQARQIRQLETVVEALRVRFIKN